MGLGRYARGGVAVAIAATLCVISAGCEKAPPPSNARPNSTATPFGAAPSTSAKAGVGGCGRVFPPNAKMPSWTATAGPPTGLPWVMSASGNMVGILFGQPLRVAPRDDGISNKILWISRSPREGQTLQIAGQRLSDGKTANATEPADSSPGEIYPSIVDMPGQGCWRLDLTWGPNTAIVYLYYGD